MEERADTKHPEREISSWADGIGPDHDAVRDPWVDWDIVTENHVIGMICIRSR